MEGEPWEMGTAHLEGTAPAPDRNGRGGGERAGSARERQLRWEHRSPQDTRHVARDFAQEAEFGANRIPGV